jgi:RHS repeat-associated protein
VPPDDRRCQASAGGADDPIFWYHGAAVGIANRRQLFGDPQGSIVAITDGYGIRTHINAYDEYGLPGAANTGRFQYTGQIWMPELGMYHYKARLYSPTLGRFLQTDPVGYDDQFNLYEYVGNDPVNQVDPTGETAQQAAQWAYNHRNNRDYQLSDAERRVGGLRQTLRHVWDPWNRGIGAPKCNFFVYDALAAGGIAPNRMVYSADWGNANSRIENAGGRFRPLTTGEKARPGDVISNGDHVGMLVAMPRGGKEQGSVLVTASAATPDVGNRVTFSKFGFRSQDHLERVVTWRYVPHNPCGTGECQRH